MLSVMGLCVLRFHDEGKQHGETSRITKNRYILVDGGGEEKELSVSPLTVELRYIQLPALGASLPAALR